MSQYLDKDGASRIAENFLSKQAEQDAILANLQFDLKKVEHALVKTIQGPAPLSIRALTRPLDDYLISGNTVQEGTPAPDAPVDVVGCGERTENIYDKTNTIILPDIGIRYGVYAQPGVYSIYNDTVNPVLYFVNDGYGRYEACPSKSSVTITLPISPPNKKSGFLMPYNDESLGDVSIVAGSTPPSSYIPYGYKLPITVNNTEYPIYLGNVPTTRKIKKRVLTGEESWTYEQAYSRFFISVEDFASLGLRLTPFISNTFGCVSDGRPIDDVPNNTMYSGSPGNDAHKFYIKCTTYTSIGDFKQWLSDQYSAGTPVVVWYVLAEPETAIVNEPLHKIGDYADTVSMAQAGVEISTTKGFNTITTDTTVLPSNIEVKGVINNA